MKIENLSRILIRGWGKAENDVIDPIFKKKFNSEAGFKFLFYKSKPEKNVKKFLKTSKFKFLQILFHTTKVTYMQQWLPTYKKQLS